VSWQVEAASGKVQGVGVMADFSQSISTLCGAIDGISELCRSILNINSGNSALDQVGELGGITDEVCQLLDAWVLRASSEGIRTNFLRVRLDLEDLHKIGMCFRMVSTLTAVNTSGMESAMMAGFIQDLRAMPDKIDSGVDEVLTRLSRVDNVSQTAVTAAKSGLHALGNARTMLADQSTTSREVVQQVLYSQAAIEDLGSRFIETSHAQTKALVTSFQFSDFFSQRLEHIADMLGREREVGPAVLHLAATQLAALTQDGYAIVAQIDNALRAQDRAMTKFETSFRSQSLSADDGNAKQRGIFSSVLTSRERALPAIAEAVSASERVLQEITSCNESFAKLVEMSGVIDVAAMNARIRASRSGNAQRAMAMLSATVIENATTCRETLGGCSKGLEQVAAVQDVGSMANLVSAVNHFSQALDACETGLRLSEERVERLQAYTNEVAHLIRDAGSMLQSCSQTANQVKKVLKNLAEMGQRMTLGLRAPAVWPDMTAIYDTYTMQSERDVHDLLIGRPLAPPPVTNAEMALDDILF